MNQSTIWKGVLFVLSIVATALITRYVSTTMDTVEEGSQALDDQHIRTLAKEEAEKVQGVVLIDGKEFTIPEALSKISNDVTVMKTTLDILVE